MEELLEHSDKLTEQEILVIKARIADDYLHDTLKVRYYPLEILMDHTISWAITSKEYPLTFSDWQKIEHRLTTEFLLKHVRFHGLTGLPNRFKTQRLCTLAVTNSYCQMGMVPDKYKTFSLCRLALKKDPDRTWGFPKRFWNKLINQIPEKGDATKQGK
jgi:hypothetical protein